jgi:hypothetical protein
MTTPFIDQSVYPDADVPPADFASDGERADYVHRICAAWDYGIHPDPQTFNLFSAWKDIFDRFPIATSPAYHAMRAWFGWSAVPYPKNVPAPVPRWVHMDRFEGRDADPCEHMI